MAEQAKVLEKIEPQVLNLGKIATNLKGTDIGRLIALQIAEIWETKKQPVLNLKGVKSIDGDALRGLRDAAHDYILMYHDYANELNKRPIKIIQGKLGVALAIQDALFKGLPEIRPCDHYASPLYDLINIAPDAPAQKYTSSFVGMEDEYFQQHSL